MQNFDANAEVNVTLGNLLAMPARFFTDKAKQFHGVEYRGAITLAEAKSALLTIAWLVHISGINRILMDFSAAVPLMSYLDHFEMAKFIVEEMPDPVKMTIVESNENYQEHGRYVECCAKCFEVGVRVFTEREPAVKWLIE